MKNLVLFAGVMVAVCFASCGGNKAEAPVEAEAVVEEVVEAACCQADSCCGDSCCQAADSCCAAAAEAVAE